MSLMNVSNEHEIPFATELLQKKRCTYILFRVTGDTVCQLEQPLSADPSQTPCEQWHSFMEREANNEECFYALYNLRYLSKTDQVEREKLCFVMYVPDGAKRNQKMITAMGSSIIRVLLKFTGVNVQINSKAFDYDDAVGKACARLTVK